MIMRSSPLPILSCIMIEGADKFVKSEAGLRCVGQRSCA